ncbi:hypothetical protein GPL15_05540 [Clostridium sp. MCC353]|uniref:hypothetical protein n=1 Tax=Clostridium sp. MCC353 TaxID=2592646 RepID=UPI001C0257D6|nr:hypothetical protein [Clostridium sp. MCC353]MBT9775965.1 hypothetical protein [Clostridium sp. MCC353]
MAEKDLYIKKLLEDKVRFADFNNEVIFGGIPVLDADDLELIPNENGIITVDEGGKKLVVQRRRDMVMQASDKLGIGFAILGCEGQANIHYGMTVRKVGRAFMSA